MQCNAAGTARFSVWKIDIMQARRPISVGEVQQVVCLYTRFGKSSSRRASCTCARPDLTCAKAPREHAYLLVDLRCMLWDLSNNANGGLDQAAWDPEALDLHLRGAVKQNSISLSLKSCFVVGNDA